MKAVVEVQLHAGFCIAENDSSCVVNEQTSYKQYMEPTGNQQEPIYAATVGLCACC